MMCEYLINGWICWILQLLQGKDVFPVDGAAVTVEQVGPRQKVAAGADEQD